jgi:hypothetical protein
MFPPPLPSPHVIMGGEGLNISFFPQTKNMKGKKQEEEERKIMIHLVISLQSITAVLIYFSWTIGSPHNKFKSPLPIQITAFQIKY